MEQQEIDEQAQTVGAFGAQWALRTALPVGVVTGLVVILLNLNRRLVPFIDDPRGFGTILFIASLAVALIGGGAAYVMGTRFRNERVAPRYRRAWQLGVVPISVAYLVVAALGVGLLIELINNAFEQLALALMQGAILAGLITAAVSNWIVTHATQLDLRKLLTMIVIIISVGLYNSMARNDNPLWWRVSFSYLGTLDSNPDARAVFNITLIFGGVLLMLMQQFLMSDIRALNQHGAVSDRALRFFQVSLIVLGVAVAFIGIFKSRATPFTSVMHNLSAYSLAVILFVYMVGARRLIPQLPQEFYVASLIGVIIMAATLLLAALGYFNTVGLEIISFVLGGTWLGSFVKNTEFLARRLEPDAFVE